MIFLAYSLTGWYSVYSDDGGETWVLSAKASSAGYSTSEPTLNAAPDGALIGRCRPVLNGAHGMWRGPDGRIFLSEQNPSRLTCLVPV